MSVGLSRIQFHGPLEHGHRPVTEVMSASFDPKMYNRMKIVPVTANAIAETS
jgi:hypothetical protein